MKKKPANTDSDSRAFRFFNSILKLANDLITLGMFAALVLLIFLENFNVEVKDYLIDPVCDFNFLVSIMCVSLLSVWTSRWLRSYAEYHQQLFSLDYPSFSDSQNSKMERMYKNISDVGECEDAIKNIVNMVEESIKNARRKNEREAFVKMMEGVDAARSELGEIKELMEKLHSQDISQMRKKQDDYSFANSAAQFYINANSILFFINLSTSGYAAVSVSYAILTLDLSQGHSCKV